MRAAYNAFSLARPALAAHKYTENANIILKNALGFALNVQRFLLLLPHVCNKLTREKKT